jgi:hypothetical protein
MTQASPLRGDVLPWGRATGFLGACAVTLIGVARELEPEVVLGRAAGAGLALGLLACLVRWVVDRFLIPQ